MASSGLPRATSPVRAARADLREVALLAYPVVLSNLSLTLLRVVDTAFVGRLGTTELGAVGYGAIWYWTALCGFLGTASGVQVFVAQAHGAGRAGECGGWAWQSLYLIVPCATLWMALFAAGFGPLLAALDPSPELRGHATAYVRSLAAGAPAASATMVLASFFRGLGDTRTPLYAMLAANALNVLLDYGLIFGNLGLPAWGVAGAGVASAIAEWLGAALLFAAFRRGARLRPFATAAVRPRAAAMRRFSRTATPIGGQWLLEMLSFALFSTLVARMGDRPMAATQALITLLHLSFMQALGVSVAASTLVGRYVGAGDFAAARRSSAASLRLGLALAVGVGALFLAAPEALLRLFTRDPELLAAGTSLLLLGAGFQALDAVSVIAGGALRGAGDTRWPFWMQTALAWCLFLPAAWLLGVGLGGGLLGAWAGGLLYVAALATVMLRRLRSGAWQRMQI